MRSVKAKRVGIIDLGTNSVRFDVRLLGSGKAGRLLHREKMMVRLGDGVFLRGRLEAAAVERTVHAITRFKRLAEAMGVDEIVAFGTCTLREVADRRSFLQRVRKASGIGIRVISGEEEAKLIAAAILALDSRAKGRFATVDIGGGSTEISVCRNQVIEHCESFPLGAARLQQLFPVIREEKREHVVERMRAHIRSVLLSRLYAESWPHVDRLLGSSGTVRALSRIMKKTRGRRAISLDALKRLVVSMSGLDETRLLAIPGMEPKRVDIIVAGAVLLEECMTALGARETHFTPYALRDGILLELGRSEAEVRRGSEFDLFPLYARASRFGWHETYLKELVKDAELLFTKLRRLHGLGPEWLRFLTIAVVFRDVGWAISPVEHERHSAYIVKHADLPFEAEWETELVARLCRYHEAGKLPRAAIAIPGTKRSESRKIFEKLLSLLRIVDALEPLHHERAALENAHVRGEAVRLVLTSRAGVELAKQRIEERKELFERTFGHRLLVEDGK